MDVLRSLLLAPIALAGCITAADDGHYDACHEIEGGVDPAEDGVNEHGQCVYSPTPAVALDDPDAYEKGYARGVEDCQRKPYIDAWVEAEAASPCAEIVFASEELP